MQISLALRELLCICIYRSTLFAPVGTPSTVTAQNRHHGGASCAAPSGSLPVRCQHPPGDHESVLRHCNFVIITSSHTLHTIAFVFA